MILKNVLTRYDREQVSIELEGGIIKSIGREIAERKTGEILSFDQSIAFPGLINSHDHLDFNSFPRLGDKIYKDYVEWGDDIHARHATLISIVLKIPIDLRIRWSLYRNLLCGVTTVVQHGPKFNVANDLIDVFQDCVSIHSVKLEKNWKRRLNKPRWRKQNVVIHIGEGTNDGAHTEIDQLISWNLFRRDLVGIHGIAMDDEQASKFKALVWCADSNYFLFGHTADIARLKQKTSIVFGSDSTLSASWDIWEQLAISLGTGYVSAEEMYKMVTDWPAEVWGYKQKAALRSGADADIVIAKQKGDDFYSSFASVTPADIELVTRKGQIVLFDESVLCQLDPASVPIDPYSRISVYGAVKYVYGDLPEVLRQIKEVYSDFNPKGVVA